MVYRSFQSPAPTIDGKSILVTGGTGSFGSNFVKHLVTHHKPRRLIIYSRDELKQHEMSQKFDPKDLPFLRYFIGDIRDRDRLTMAMRGVDYVIHAAALKHVPIAEYNPMECINTNVIGSENVVKAALQAGVNRVIALSTDKAANPVNLYGASKLAADKVFVAANNLAGENGCRFSVVRYGNVVGSRGGVLDLFKRLVEEGADTVPITDPDMTRFWITLEQAVHFVLSSLSMMEGGEIFVPKIPSMKITDFAACMAPGLKQKVIGVRPGEKLHESMISPDDSRTTLDLGDRFAIMPAFSFWNDEEKLKKSKHDVMAGFGYSSDSNDEWLTVSQMRDLLDKGSY